MGEAKTKIKEATKDICALLEKLQTGMLHEFANLPHDEAGAIADMIKDLAEAKASVTQCVYYELLAEDLEDGEEEPDKMGYRGRDRRTGRYVSRGYTPDEAAANYRMGYHDGHMCSCGKSEAAGYTQSRHGTAYDTYQAARRFYTESPTEENKRKMQTSWEDALDDAIQAIRKMYTDAEPGMKRKVNERVTRALQEMPPM